MLRKVEFQAVRPAARGCGSFPGYRYTFRYTVLSEIFRVKDGRRRGPEDIVQIRKRDSAYRDHTGPAGTIPANHRSLSGVPFHLPDKEDFRRCCRGLLSKGPEKPPFLSISRAAPLISLSFATGYCRLLFLQRQGKRSDWRKSLRIEGGRKSLYINGGVLHIIPGMADPGAWRG